MFYVTNLQISLQYILNFTNTVRTQKFHMDSEVAVLKLF